MLTYDDETAEGSIYLGTEHCQFNSEITFLALNKTTFDIELTMAIEFNIETINLDESGFVKIRTQVDFTGFMLYSSDMLPSFKSINNPIAIVKDFIDISNYQTEFSPYTSGLANWKQLKPKE